MRINPVSMTPFNGKLRIIVKGDPKTKTRESYVSIDTDDIQAIEEDYIYTRNTRYFCRDRNSTAFSNTNPQYNTLLTAYTAACQNDNVIVEYNDRKFEKGRNY